MGKIKQKVAYFNIGIVPIRNNLNKIESKQKYIVLPERFAKFIAIPVVTTPPAAKTVLITKGKLKGRSKTVEFQSKVSGIKYELGYYIASATTKADPKRAARIKWIPIHIPRGLHTKEFLKVVEAKIPRKPHFIKMPSGITVRLKNA